MPSFPERWSIAGIRGPDSSRLPERLGQTVANVRYELSAFPKSVTPSAFIGGYTNQTSIDVDRVFEDAARTVVGTCAQHRSCNRYFSSLGKGVTLSDLLTWRIVWYFWKPVSRSGPAPAVGDRIKVVAAEVLTANHETRFAQIAVCETSLVSDIRLAATIVHELAHIAGAPGATDEQRGKARKGTPEYDRLIAAETALLRCLLTKQFDSGALGLIQESRGWRGGGQGLA